MLERKLDEFHPLFRTRVRALAERHERLKDLAASFPALLFHLAVPRGGIDQERGIALVIAGARLRDVAAAVEIPLWLKRFPAAAFSRVIPVLPDGELVARQIVNHAPKKARAMGDWLGVVADAYDCADPEVAVWAAREFPLRPAKRRSRTARERMHTVWVRRRRRACLWAWYCRNVQDYPCAPAAKWTPSMKMDAAIKATNEWLSNLSLRFYLGDGPLEDAWGAPGNVAGFDFVPLVTYRDIVDEALEMKHCVRSYGSDLAMDSSRLWSLRRDGTRVATLELCFRHEAPFPDVAQIKLKDNKQAPVGIWLAARAWLSAQGSSRFASRIRKDDVVLDASAWLATWRPYWIAKRRFPGWLPRQADHAAWDDL